VQTLLITGSIVVSADFATFYLIYFYSYFWLERIVSVSIFPTDPRNKS
jgi:hypothetical protein